MKTPAVGWLNTEIYANLLAAAESIYGRLKQEWTGSNTITDYREELTEFHVLCQEVRLMSTKAVNAAAWRVSEKIGEAVYPEARRHLRIEEWKEEYKQAVSNFVITAGFDINADPDRRPSA